VANEGFYTFSLNGNSCHFDTFFGGDLLD
jgi:hypothetical protein